MEHKPTLLLAGAPEDYQPDAAEIATALDEAEQTRYRRLRVPLFRRRFVYGRLLLRQTLTRLTGDRIAPESWQFTHTRLGKPLLVPSAGIPPFHFSISYAGRFIALAVSVKNRIGIDLEAVPKQEFPGISVALSDEEKNMLARCFDQERIRKTIQIWTIKEAYSKLLGLGAALDFFRLSVSLTDPPILNHPGARRRESETIGLHSSCLWLHGQQYILSLALEEKKTRKRE